MSSLESHGVPVYVEDASSDSEFVVPVSVYSRSLEGRWVWLILALVMVVLAGGVSFMNKKIVEELRGKDFQVNSLIEELGEVRAENQKLYQEVLNRDDTLILLEESLIALENKVEAVDGSDGLFGLQAQLDAAKAELVAQDEALKSLMSAGLAISDDVLVSKDETLDFLILGTHGRLTDTIILASVNSQKETVSLFSLPRDLAVNGRRINEYYYRYGIDAMRDQIQTMTGLYPEQYVVFDLATFEEVIDLLGGVDVTLEEPLYDSLYPGPNYTYTTFSLSAGAHHLDGKTALQFARSRKSTTDFDRAARQQQLVAAVQQKFTELDLLGDTEQLIAIYNAVVDGMNTDVSLLSLITYATHYKDYTIERGNVLSTRNYLYSTIGTDGAYLVLPQDPTYTEIRAYIAGVVKE